MKPLMKTAFLCVALTALSACASHTTNNAEKIQEDTPSEKKAVEYGSSAGHYPGGDLTYSVIWYSERPHARREKLAFCYPMGFKSLDCMNAKSAAIGAGDEAYVAGKATPSSEDATYNDVWYSKHPTERRDMLTGCRQRDPSYKTQECHNAALGASHSSENAR